MGGISCFPTIIVTNTVLILFDLGMAVKSKLSCKLSLVNSRQLSCNYCLRLSCDHKVTIIALNPHADSPMLIVFQFAQLLFPLTENDAIRTQTAYFENRPHVNKLVLFAYQCERVSCLACLYILICFSKSLFLREEERLICLTTT